MLRKVPAHEPIFTVHRSRPAFTRRSRSVGISGCAALQALQRNRMGKAAPKPEALRQAVSLPDLTDYIQPPRPRGASKRASRKTLVVTDDWPEIVPISERELRVIEGHFADLLDELLGPRF